MQDINIGRRHVLLEATFVGLAAMLPIAGMAQQSGSAASLKLPSTDIGKYHRKFLIETTLLLNAQTLFTEKAFDVQIDRLVKNGIIDEGNADILKAFSRRLLSGQAFEEIFHDLQSIAEKLKGANNEVAAAIGSIVEDSLLYVQEFGKKLDNKDLALVIAHDFQGAISGAVLGAELGVIIAGLGAIPGAVFGALAGAAASSTIGALGPK
ncbi:hypothetical protein [Pseudomonas syringae]|uniref:hypothetical protein n=1 Tax=Pseudomonas syringae TaxID=317 RepID=UPI000816A2B1|nr:hypothetical protein [Pseudomonas syringae]